MAEGSQHRYGHGIEARDVSWPRVCRCKFEGLAACGLSRSGSDRKQG